MMWQVRLLAWLPLAVVCLLTSTATAAQEAPDPVAELLAARVSLFLETVSRGQAQEAYGELLRGSQLITQTDALEALIQQTGQIETTYGEYREFEPVETKRIGGDLVLMRYLYKCESFPVVWYFTFYRTPARGETAADSDAWRVIAVRFDTRLDRLAF